MSVSESLDRFKNKKWGIFNHFLGGFDAKAWNDRVDKVDVDLWAKQLSDLGCGFFGITIMQCSQLMLAPNDAYNRITGYKPGQACVKRDFIADLSDALQRYDIDLMLYFTGDGPCRDSNNIANKAFGFATTTPKLVNGNWYSEQYPDFVPPSFVEKWCEVLSEYASRYKDRVFAWWIDGCWKEFYPDEYRELMLGKYKQAIRNANPNALVTFNGGYNQTELLRHSCHEDFTAGETGELLPIPEGRFVDGSQWFEFLCSGFWWQGGDRSSAVWTGSDDGVLRPRFSPEQLRDYVKAVNDKGGIVMFDTQFVDDKYIDKAQYECMSKLKELL